ncbi:MAG: hypothetical protein WBX00_01300, partial [Isosphaeraceae bacterium]
TRRCGSKSRNAPQAVASPWARASSHQSRRDLRGGTRQVRIRPQHRAHKAGQAVGSGGVGVTGP